MTRFSEYAESVPALNQLATAGMKHLPRLASVLPPLLLAQLASRLLNEILQPALKQGALAELEARWLAIDCTDLPYPLRVSRAGTRLLVQANRGPIDASIRGDLPAFLTLLRQDTDPDTLFFQRRLTMQGDTELALLVKNFLDTLEPQQMPAFLRYLLRHTSTA